MFRNPRQNDNSPTTTPLKPSTGRAPTPPNTSRPLPSVLNHSSTKASAPGPMPKTNFPTAPKQGTKKITTVKTPGKPNSSILNFFKKIDSPIQDDSIFIAQRAGASGTVVRAKASSPDTLDVDLEDLYGGGSSVDSGRYNEVNGSLKRRKTSQGDSKRIEEQITHLVPFDEAPIANACSPPLSEPISHSKPVKQKRRGPFLSDSDTDDDVDNFIPPKAASKEERQKFVDIVVDQTKTISESITVDSVNRYHIHENSPLVSTITSVELVNKTPPKCGKIVHVGVAQAKWEALQPCSSRTDDEEDHSKLLSRTVPNKSPAIPSLKKESTSMDDWGKFDDVEDFPDNDEFSEGEEFTERKWMEEQARLEAAEQDGNAEILNSFDYELPEQTPDEDATTKCPICDGSLQGVKPDLATRHVNGCLDGNLVPLPTVKQEGKLIPVDAKTRFSKKAAIARPGQANPFQIGSSSVAPSSAFSKLMSGHAEDAAWAVASASEHASRGKPAYQRTCPFYKIMPGFFICVDAFRYGAVQDCEAYFLSHFHSDHYIGLTSSWCHGPIYCSQVTANLVKQQLRVDPKWVVALEFEQRFEIPGTNGVIVTMIPANHCPGSSLYLYEKVVGKGADPKVQRVLHCGDFRACPAHISHPLLMPDLVDSITGKTKQQKIDVCYLDTTYLNPRYSFPSQEEVIKACADMCVSLKKERAEESDAWEVAKRERAGTGMTKFVNSSIKAEDDSIAMSLVTKDNKPRGRLLVICGTYSIGKERICLGIARALDCKIWAPPGKMRICKALEDSELWSRMTDDPKEAQIHMQMLMEIRAETLQEYLNGYKPHFTRIVGFRPSGWNYRPPNSR